MQARHPKPDQFVERHIFSHCAKVFNCHSLYVDTLSGGAHPNFSARTLACRFRTHANTNVRTGPGVHTSVNAARKCASATSGRWPSELIVSRQGGYDRRMKMPYKG